MAKRIIVVDDEDGMRRYLNKMLTGWGYEAETFADPLLMLKFLGQADSECDLVLLDVKMPEMDGIEALTRIRSIRPDLPVIMMTGHGTIDSAVEAMKIGAYDYLSKPFPQEKLQTLLVHAMEREKLREENLSLKKELQERHTPGKPVFVSDKFRQVYELALRVAASDANILVLGESGTGKELIAGTIHYASPRAANRFLAINCAALSETLLESQLFGHVKGSFTGALQSQKGFLEEADGGTLFLDEVGDISPGLQAKLLRVIQEGEFIPVGATRPKKVDVRFIAVTNKDLEKEVAEGRFREDLYYRLNVICLNLPPLRERREDIVPLAQHFLEKMIQKMKKNLQGIAPEALEVLQNYHWPGNIRELQNVIERAAILALDDQITVDLLPIRLSAAPTPAPITDTTDMPLSLREAERRQINRAMKKTAGNKSQAALLLGITRKTLDRKIKEFDTPAPEEADTP